MAKIYIDYDKCVNCGVCIDLCQEGVYAEDSQGTLYVKDESLCAMCRECVDGCPLGAITLRGLVAEA